MKGKENKSEKEGKKLWKKLKKTGKYSWTRKTEENNRKKEERELNEFKNRLTIQRDWKIENWTIKGKT